MSPAEPLRSVPHARQDERVTITVLATQLEALRGRLGDELSDDDLYSAAAIAVLLYLPSVPPAPSTPR